MYRVTIYNGDEATIIHEPTVRPEDPHLYAGTLVQGSSGEIDSLTMELLPNNPGYELLNSRTTLVQVLDTSTDEAIFTGRVLTITPQMEDSGLIYKTVVCEDRLGYLCDSVQPYTPEATYYGDDESSGVEKFLALLLENHNAQVEDYKKIYCGDISYTTSSNNCTKGLNYETTWEAITSKLLTDLGGEIRLKEGVDGLLYLDYVPELGETVDDVTIELGKNMTSISQEIDPTSIITRLIPLGARLESDDGETDTDERVTIASVNDGCIWIDDTDAQAIYGIVAGTVEWEDVTEPANLLTRAEAWLAAQIRTDKISLTALDLSLIGLQPDAIRRYNRYQVVNAAIGLDASIRVLKRTVNLCDPTDISYEMGERSSTITSTVNSSGQRVKQLYTGIVSFTAIANGKTTSYYADEAPEGTGYTVNDIWFDTSNGYAMYYWNGSEWVKAQYGTNAIADGVITSNLIASEAITAGKIASGAITAAKIDVDKLSAISANLGDITGGSLNIGNGTFVVDSDGNLTAKSGTFSGNIVGGTIKIGSNFSVDALGNVTATDAVLGGTLYLYDDMNEVYIASLQGNGTYLVVLPDCWFEKNLVCDGNGAFSGSLSTYGYTVPRIQTGGLTVSVTASTATTFSVTFSTEFPGTPYVFLSIGHNSSVTNLSYKVMTKSSTGFTGYIYSSGGGTHAVNWLATYTS